MTHLVLVVIPTQHCQALGFQPEVLTSGGYEGQGERSVVRDTVNSLVQLTLEPDDDDDRDDDVIRDASLHDVKEAVHHIAESVESLRSENIQT